MGFVIGSIIISVLIAIAIVLLACKDFLTFKKCDDCGKKLIFNSQVHGTWIGNESLCKKCFDDRRKHNKYEENIERTKSIADRLMDTRIDLGKLKKEYEDVRDSYLNRIRILEQKQKDTDRRLDDTINSIHDLEKEVSILPATCEHVPIAIINCEKTEKE